MDTNNSRPTLWMALAGVGLVLAVGLGIWAFTLRSDLSDTEDKLAKANATVRQQRSQIATQEEAADQVESQQRTALAADRRALRRLARRYRTVRGRFIREEKEAAALKSDVAREAAQLQQARNEVSSADSAEERVAAQLTAARQQSDLAAACARRALAISDNIVGDFDDVDDDAAADDLSDLEDQCADTVGE